MTTLKVGELYRIDSPGHFQHGEFMIACSSTHLLGLDGKKHRPSEFSRIVLDEPSPLEARVRAMLGGNRA